MNELVSEYIDDLSQWKEEITLLRTYVLTFDLVETYKWKQPCYTFEGKNVLIISGFKDCCFISFLKGVLINDPKGKLVFPGDNSQSSKMLKFTSLTEIEQQEQLIKDFIEKAIENERLGKKVQFKSVESFDYPHELLDEFEKDSNFKRAFEALTVGRQKGYLLHFSGAKQSSTRRSRILILKERILDGYGLRDCTCGQSNRMPQCDGSHKYLESK